MLSIELVKDGREWRRELQPNECPDILEAGEGVPLILQFLALLIAEREKEYGTMVKRRKVKLCVRMLGSQRGSPEPFKRAFQI